MKINDLIEREPFGRILEQTVSSFLKQWTGREHQVAWHGQAVPRAAAQGSQVWFCNSWLNALFTKDSDPANFRFLRAQYSGSPVLWRRGPQKIVVMAATQRWTATAFARQALTITPAIEEGSRYLITGGNNRIRIFDIPGRSVFTVLKAGFDHRYIERELTTRANASDWPFPEVLDAASDYSWFKEPILDGIPVNRLRTGSERQSAEAEAYSTLSRWHAQTRSCVQVKDYAKALGESIVKFMAAGNAFPAATRKWIAEEARNSVQVIERLSANGGRAIDLCRGHGDFQPGNILYDADRMWIIDWEHAGERQLAYDALVYALHGRAPSGLAARLSQFLMKPSAFMAASLVSAWPELREPNATRWRLIIAVFLLEQMVWFVEQNCNLLFRGPDQAFLQFRSEWPECWKLCAV